MDAMSGNIYTYPSTKADGKLTMKFHLEPAGSLLLYSSKGSLKSYPEIPAVAGSTPVQAISPVQVTRLKDNALNVDFCDVSVNGKTTKNVYFAQAADIAFREYGFTNGNPWNTSVQYKRNILDRDTFKTGGFTTTYRFKVK